MTSKKFLFGFVRPLQKKSSQSANSTIRLCVKVNNYSDIPEFKRSLKQSLRVYPQQMHKSENNSTERKCLRLKITPRQVAG